MSSAPGMAGAVRAAHNIAAAITNPDSSFLIFKNYYYANLISLFDRYCYNISVNDCNLSLFLCLISIVWKVDFSSTNFNNCFRVRSLLDYVNKVFNFISEKDKENEKTNENKLEEEDNNI